LRAIRRTADCAETVRSRFERIARPRHCTRPDQEDDGVQVTIKQITGSWDDGYALAKHVLSSSYIGDDDYGHPQFATTRSDPGEALFQLKYRADWSQVDLLADAIATHIVPLLGRIGLIVPVPASNPRPRQPVTEIAVKLGQLIGRPVFTNLIVVAPAATAVSLKNLGTRAEKDAALAGRFSVVDGIEGDGPWNALLVDDLFDTGASMDATCAALRTYRKIGTIYAAAVSWK
jgi:predicted amidophosphoribosyltransferase